LLASLGGPFESFFKVHSQPIFQDYVRRLP
jgi:hypothetical protein